MITGARLKDEITALTKVTGSITKLKVAFNGGELQAGAGEGFINLPNLPSNIMLTRTEAQEYRGLSDHESFHHRFTDLKLWKEAAIYCNDCNDSVSMSVWNGAEDPRIERLGINVFPGTRRNLMATCDKWLKMTNAQGLGLTNSLGFLALKIAYLGRVANDFDFNLTNYKELERHFESIGMDDELKSLSEPDDGKELLEGVADFLSEYGIPTLRNFLDGVPAQKKNDEEKGSDPDSTDDQKGGGEGEGELPTELINPDLELIMGSLTTDRPYYCREDRIQNIKLEPLSQPDEKEIAPYRRYANGFANALKTNLQTRKDRSSQVGHLNGSRLVDAYNRGDSIWKAKKSYQRGFDTALSFVIDCSGSMQYRIASMVGLTTALCESVRAVGIPFEVSGFTEWDGELEIDEHSHYVREGYLNIYHAKGFDEPFNPCRLASLRSQNLGYTPDSEALEQAVGRIKGRREKRKVVIILTDGSPQTVKDMIVVDGIPHRTEPILLSHRKSVIAQAQNDGVEVFCIGVGHEKFVHFDPRNVMQVRGIEELNHNIFNLFYQAIIQGA